MSVIEWFAGHSFGASRRLPFTRNGGFKRCAPCGMFPIDEFPALYASRWESELLFDAVKTELRGGTGVRFRSGTPDLVRQEAWALLLVYQALSDLIGRAAGPSGLDPDRISFTTALNTARRSVNQTGRPFSPLKTLPPCNTGRSVSSSMTCCPSAETGPRPAKSPGGPSDSPPATATHPPPPGPITESTSGTSPRHQHKRPNTTVLMPSPPPG